MSHTIHDKKSLVTRVRRIGGQVALLEKALEADADCDAVLQQAASIRGAVQGLMSLLPEDHLRQHVAASNPKALKDWNPSWRCYAVTCGDPMSRREGGVIGCGEGR